MAIRIFNIIFIVISLYSLCPNLLFSAEYIENEDVSPKNIEERKDALKKGVDADKVEDQEQEKAKKKKEELEPAPEERTGIPFFKDSIIIGHLRAYNYNFESKENPDSNALAIGGELKYRSGYINNIFRLGASYFVSHGVDDKNGDRTLLLGTGGDDLNTLGNLYVDAKFKDSLIRLYRQSFSFPYINKDDSRMIPNTFEAYAFANRTEDHGITAAHVSQIKKRNAESFISMAEAAGADNSGKGTQVLALRKQFTPEFAAGAINLFTEDALNIFYSEFEYKTSPWNIIPISFAGQMTYQKSTGDELVGEFDINSYGFRVQGDYKNAIFTSAATYTGEGGRVRKPFGGTPSYLSMMINKFDRASEKAVLVGLSYNFEAFGFPELSGFTKYSYGFSAKDTVTDQDLTDITELNITIDYKVDAGPLDNFWLRLRYAHADLEGGEYNEELRAILNYKVFF